MAAPVLAVTIAPLIADSATAYTLEGESVESIKAGLKVAICTQDWGKAEELSSNLIASSAITPEHRQSLVDWRHRFSDYSKGQVKFDSVPNCEGVQPKAVEVRVQAYQTPIPRFSGSSRVATSPCYMEMRGVVTNLSHMCGTGESEPVVAAVSTESRRADLTTLYVRQVGNTVQGTLWNTGEAPANNIRLKIKGEQEGRPQQYREIDISSLAAGGQSEFQADFTLLPVNFSIESITFE
ncbi:MAG: hypothetical protein AAF579_15680 [Cyanobacteria bacterium P01_C01_bin.118]